MTFWRRDLTVSVGIVLSQRAFAVGGGIASWYGGVFPAEARGRQEVACAPLKQIAEISPVRSEDERWESA
jgi:hypothetical protein